MRQHIDWMPTVNFPYSLNLDSDFKPVAKSVPLNYKKFNFLGGEPHFQITSNMAYAKDSELIITQRYNSVADIFDIILANDAARRAGFANIKLILPYFPAARQDRVCNEGEPLTVRVFADLINGCNFNEVVILSPHSEVTPALLNNVTVLDELKFVGNIISDIIEHDNVSINKTPHINIVCPDAGAGKRVGKIASYLSNRFTFITFNLIRCEKIRDVKDGSLKDFFVQADALNGYTTIICDDLLAMGGTFIGLGEKLKEKNAGKLILFTSHADCVGGLVKMCGYFNSVYTTNSKRDYNTGDLELATNLNILKIEL
jgi:ribose-phosphate pyrophosphokinase